jgi:hypothetical protein
MTDDAFETEPISIEKAGSQTEADTSQLSLEIGKIKKNESEENKRNRLEREKTSLLASLSKGDFSVTRTKVAGILNLYPDARNSDVVLALKYWESFQPDVYQATGILPRDLFKLERFNHIVRARAKIQNEYGLFKADEKIQGRRKNLEEKMQQEVLEDILERKIISIYADETGKNGNFTIVAAVWVLLGRAVFTVTQAIEGWREASPWSNQEIHFSSLGKSGDLKTLEEYLEIIQCNREFLGFKFIAIDKSKTSRKPEEIVIKLHEHMLIQGAIHEISSGRADLPREIKLIMDESSSLDGFTLREMKERVTTHFHNSYQSKLKLSNIETVSSRENSLVQLADLVAGAMNRKLNHEGDRKMKDDLADIIINKLGRSLTEESLPSLDATAFIYV